MAAEIQKQEEKSSSTQENKDIFSSYLGLSFTIFLGFLPKSSIFLLPSLQSHNRALSLKLHQAECELKDLYSKRKEDSKANARVVEIFASYRHAWMQEEKRLLHRIDVGAQEIEILRVKLEDFEKSEVEFKSSVEDLKRDVHERDEMLSFMVRSSEEVDEFEGLGARFGEVRVSDGVDSCFVDNGVNYLDEMGGGYLHNNGFGMDFAHSSSKFWAERTSPRQV